MSKYAITTLQTVLLFFFAAQLHSQMMMMREKAGVVSAAKKKRAFVMYETDTYSPDPKYIVKGNSRFQVLDDLKPGPRLMLNDISKAVVLKYHIKSVKYFDSGAVEYRRLEAIEKFDANGNKNMNNTSAYRYEYGNNNTPISIAMIDTGDTIIATAGYKYDSSGRLLQAGDYVLKYNYNGLIKSVENRTDIERYTYDYRGNLVHIKYDLQPRVITCGNRAIEWNGEYDNKGHLIKEEFIDPDRWFIYYKYSRAGLPIKSKTVTGRDDRDITTYYIYTNGLLTETRNFDTKGKLAYTESFEYEYF